MAEEILWIVSFAIFVFFVVYIVATFALIGMSLVETTLTKIERGEVFSPPLRLRRPGISLIAPAYNTEPLIVASVRSLLASDYEPLEVVIVDDGSDDGTSEKLIAAFDLIELPIGDRLLIPSEPIHQLYVSRSDPRLQLVRKENGGRSDAINAGINFARRELVAIVDSDTLLEPDALKRIGEVFAADPDDVVAVGGTIRIVNGAVVENNAVTVPRVASTGVEATQTAEYLRGFLGGRIAWSRLNGLLIISGAFGVFHRDLLLRTGGLSKETLGEDMELVMRLHHQLRPTRPQTQISYAADAKMAGYAILIAMILLGLASWWYVAAFLLVTVLVGQLQTAGAILVEEVGFRRYRERDLMMIAGWSLLELFWYRPITAVWRTWATVLVVVGRRPGWGSIPRGTALGHEGEAEITPTPLPR